MKYREGTVPADVGGSAFHSPSFYGGVHLSRSAIVRSMRVFTKTITAR
jgi:hypothetical protein